MPIDTVIFDLDGTITQPFFDFDAMRKDMGLAPDAGPILELMEQMTEERRSHTKMILDKHEAIAIEKSTLNDGAAETLDKLHRQNINLGILTRNSKENAHKTLDRHNLVFDHVIGREAGPVKPDPFGVEYLCEKFNTSPKNALMVGDFLYDLLSGKAAGAKAVLITTHKDYEDFRPHADYTIDALPELLTIIQQCKSN